MPPCILPQHRSHFCCMIIVRGSRHVHVLNVGRNADFFTVLTLDSEVQDNLYQLVCLKCEYFNSCHLSGSVDGRLGKPYLYSWAVKLGFLMIVTITFDTFSSFKNRYLGILTLIINTVGKWRIHQWTAGMMNLYFDLGTSVFQQFSYSQGLYFFFIHFLEKPNPSLGSLLLVVSVLK